MRRELSRFNILLYFLIVLQSPVRPRREISQNVFLMTVKKLIDNHNCVFNLLSFLPKYWMQKSSPVVLIYLLKGLHFTLTLNIPSSSSGKNRGYVMCSSTYLRGSAHPRIYSSSPSTHRHRVSFTCLHTLHLSNRLRSSKLEAIKRKNNRPSQLRAWIWLLLKLLPHFNLKSNIFWFSPSARLLTLKLSSFLSSAF